jgi:hypothetical protein
MCKPLNQEEILETINELLPNRMVSTVHNLELKGYYTDEEGGGCKFYLTRKDCQTLAKAFEDMAKLLRSE